MTKLTDTQLIVLSKAAQRDDGAANVPEKMNRAAAAKVAASLVARKLMKETKAKPGMPVWREKDGEKFSLVITRAGREAIGVGEAEECRSLSDRSRGDDGAAQPQRRFEGAPLARSKQALVIEMLSTPNGVTIEALIEATGWLPHTTRAVLSGLRKRGYAVDRSKAEGGESVYRISTDPAVPLRLIR